MLATALPCGLLDTEAAQMPPDRDSTVTRSA